MFLSRKLNEISDKISRGISTFSPDEVNEGIDALGLPFGFKYSQRFLFKAFELLPTVEKVDEYGNYRVPSESDASLVYNVSLNPLSCDCPAFARFKVSRHPFCKHISAAMLRDQAWSGDKMDFFEFCDRRNDNYKWHQDNSSFGYTPSPTSDNPGGRQVGIFSSSQLDTYTRCPAQYYFRYQKRVPMVDKETGALIQSNGSPASVQCSLDLVSDDGVILKLKTSSRSISKLEYDWSLDLQRYAYEQIKKRPNFRTSRESGQAPVEVKVVNLVRTKKPKIQVIDAPEPSRESGLAICESVIASINAGAFYPNPKNQFGCFLCGYATACEQQW